jgi:diguanylate cyclase (GGDEF)-like protein
MAAAFSRICGVAVGNAMMWQQLRHLADENARAASRDALTGLSNRRGLSDGVTTALSDRRGGARTALVLLDLDGFKCINDTLGHAAGDQVLVEVGQRLTAAVRSNDLVARWGGDEFAVLLTDLPTSAHAIARAYSLLAVLDVPFQVDGIAVAPAASAGVAAAAGVETVDELLRRADLAMYQAKRQQVAVAGYEPGYERTTIPTTNADGRPVARLAAGQASGCAPTSPHRGVSGATRAG